MYKLNFSLPMTLKVVMANTCSICMEKYNKSTRKLINQNCCDLRACRSCYTRFLLGTDVARNELGARCMSPNCKSPFSDVFVAENFTKKFVKDLRCHDAQVQADRERSLLPATQALAAMERRKVSNKKDITACAKEIEDLRAAIATLEIKKEYLRVGNDPEEWDPEKHDWGSAAVRGEVDKKTVKEFKKKCPRVDVVEDEQRPCTGFLNSKYKCGTCEKYVCSSCMQPKAGFIDPNHVCKQEDIANVELIAKTTKACPGCGIQTEKAYGCHQMWCTSCHTVWDWASEKILPQGIYIHNPEFLDAVREGNVAPRAPGDMVCGGPPNWYEINGLIRRHNLVLPIGKVGWSAIRMVSHMLEVETRRWQPRQDDNSDLRVDLINGNKTWNEFEKALEKRMKRTSLRTEVAGIIRMFCDMGTIQLQNAVAAQTQEEAIQALEGLEVLRTALNRASKNIGERFGNKSPKLHAYPPRNPMPNRDITRRHNRHNPNDWTWDFY